MTQLTDRIAALEAKLKNLKARQQKDDSRKRTLESRRGRKADTRRKILIGAIVLTRLDQGRLPKQEVTAWLDQALTRSDDRELFGLPPLAGVVQPELQFVANAKPMSQESAFRRSPGKSSSD
jgi:hypothetical protein